ncbi:hypothetical protein [Vibrio phage LP.2]|nr:hypothetical protein [Vibrio phage LP.2]
MNKFEQDKKKVKELIAQLIELGEWVDICVDSENGGYVEVDNVTHNFDEDLNLTNSSLEL